MGWEEHPALRVSEDVNQRLHVLQKKDIAKERIAQKHREIPIIPQPHAAVESQRLGIPHMPRSPGMYLATCGSSRDSCRPGPAAGGANSAAGAVGSAVHAGSSVRRRERMGAHAAAREG